MELRVLRYFLTVAKEQRPYSKAINLFIKELNMIGRDLRYGRTSIIHLFCDCGCFLINKKFK